VRPSSTGAETTNEKRDDDRLSKEKARRRITDVGRGPALDRRKRGLYTNTKSTKKDSRKGGGKFDTQAFPCSKE